MALAISFQQVWIADSYILVQLSADTALVI